MARTGRHFWRPGQQFNANRVDVKAYMALDRLVGLVLYLTLDRLPCTFDVLADGIGVLACADSVGSLVDIY